MVHSQSICELRLIIKLFKHSIKQEASMSQQNWSRLPRQQDSFVHEEDRREQQRKLRIKQLYKKQLQKMIQQQRNHAHDEKDYDKRLVDSAFKNDMKRMEKEKLWDQAKREARGQMARDNLKSTILRKQIAFSENDQQKKYYASKYRKSMTEVQEQAESRVRYQEHEKQKLAEAYQNQIREQQNRKKLQRMEDERFSQLLEELQKKKQQHRRVYFDKLRNGYRQNPQVYQTSAELLKQQQKQRTEFIRKLANTNSSQSELEKQKESQVKAKKVKQTSSYNKSAFETRAFRERYKSLQQIADYGIKFQTVQEQLQHQKQEELRQIQRKRQELKQELQRQIDESQRKARERNRMNEKELRLNKSGQIPALPGLSRDYAAEKQHRILESFLKGGSQRKLQFSA